MIAGIEPQVLAEGLKRDLQKAILLQIQVVRRKIPLPKWKEVGPKMLIRN
jgi:hypothetical protein